MIESALRILAVVLCGLATVTVSAADLRDEVWVANGPVYTSVVSTDQAVLYLGGDFDYLGPVTGSGVGMDDGGQGAADFTFPRVNGPVRAVVADGSGGWFIGGEFSQVGGLARGNLAHIDSLNNVTPWAPEADGAVRALALAGGTLYIGGEFTRIGGAGRNRIAAVVAASGAVAAWMPEADGAVHTLLLDGPTVYAGGAFGQIGGAARNRIAALDATGGAATAWNPDANGAVRALALNGATLYAGGDFTRIGGVDRNHIAALDTASGAATAWNPDADGAVRALALSGATLYAGGEFSTVDGGSRAYLAALDTAQTAAGAIDTGWNPAPNGAVRALLLNGATLYAGGEFTAMDGLERSRLAALDTGGGASAITHALWNPGAGGAVDALAQSGGGVLYAGGEFMSVNGVTRRNIAALDLATGAATAWDPDANGAVRALLLNGATLYAGGDFTAIAAEVRNRLAALNAATGIATTWNPGANGSVHALALATGAGSLYIGGTFTTLGGLPRNWLGQVSLVNGSATSWDPSPAAGTGVYALAVDGSTLYVAGDLQVIDGEARDRIAAFDTAIPEITAWTPHIDDGSVRALAFYPDSNILYAGGDFTSVAGGAQVGLVALDPADDAALPWNPRLDGPVRALVRAFDRTLLYVGGDFTSVAGVSRNRVTALAVADGTVDARWVVDMDGLVMSLALVRGPAADGHMLYAGGSFATANGAARQALAALAALPPEQSAPVTTADPAGGLFNSTTLAPIALSCDDNGGSGCVATYYTTDGSEPTTSSKLYSGEIVLTANMVLKFFSVDHAGNVEAVRTESYSVETGAPTTIAAPTSRVFDSSSIRVTLSCDDGAGSGCAATYYTLDGSQPSTASTLYTGPITINDSTVLKFFSVDAAGNVEGVNREEYAQAESKVGALALYEMLAIASCLLLRAGGRMSRNAAR